MIREYRDSDWSAVCDTFDRSKPFELESGGVGASFVRLADDAERTAGFPKSSVFVFEDNGHLLGFTPPDPTAHPKHEFKWEIPTSNSQPYRLLCSFSVEPARCRS
jgi:hypothetical protein